MKARNHLFLLFFCTQFISAQVDHWETVVFAEDDWKYRAGASNIPDDWINLDFDDNSWLEGPGGIGYGDGDDNTIIAQTASLYMRKNFTIEDLSKIDIAVLHADFDDGFIAYLNGVEIARSNLDGNPPEFDAWASDYREAEMYQGGLPIGFTQQQAPLNEGENVLTIQTHNYDGANSSDLTTLYWFSLGINDNSNDYAPTPDWFTPPVFVPNEFYTPLPIVQINTNGTPINTDVLFGEMGIVWNGAGNDNYSLGTPNEFLGNVSVKKRGQTSLVLMPKNGYAIETKDEAGEDMDTSFLNFPKEEDWILHGPYSDKTLMRNVLTMQLAQRMGQYASRTRYIELMVNGQYEGIYVLMEKIKRDDNRVDIAKLNPEDISGDELTGGYVFKLDKGEVDWYSNFNMQNNTSEKLHFSHVSPKRDKIQLEQSLYIQAYVDSFENAIASTVYHYGGKRYDEYIDIESFVDHFIISELTKNVDAYRLSTYLFKDKNSKDGRIKAGPVWDYNIAYGNADYCYGPTTDDWAYFEDCSNQNPFWWDRMFNDELFINTLNCRWEEHRAGPLNQDSIFALINENAAIVSPALERNFLRWPVFGEYVWPNAFISDSYPQSVSYLRSFISGRLDWLDENMVGICPEMTSVEQTSIKTTLQLYPNPNKGVLNIRCDSSNPGKTQLRIIDVYGQVLYTQTFQTNEPVQSIDLQNIPAGTYFLELLENQETKMVERFVVLP